MKSQNNLPISLQSYDKLIVCSNTLKGGGQIFSVKGNFPLIIGKGARPQIWLYALKDAETKELTPIVENSISMKSSINIFTLKGYLNIVINGLNILSIIQRNSDTAEITSLDLRPIGFNIFGDKDKLMVGNNTFSNNTFTNIGTMINLGN